jgi:hypothetical protein
MNHGLICTIDLVIEILKFLPKKIQSLFEKFDRHRIVVTESCLYWPNDKIFNHINCFLGNLTSFWPMLTLF